MSEIWAVSAGEYSDYRVVCVCDSKERAERLAEAMRGEWMYSDATAEEFPLVDYDAEPVTYHTMTLGVSADGSGTTAGRVDERVTWPFLEPIRPVNWTWVYNPGARQGTLTVTGTDQERVQRVYSDRRARLLADPVFRAQNSAAG